MDKYYYKYHLAYCLELCPIMGNNVMMGSAWCNNCVNNKGHSEPEHYILCKKLNKYLEKT